MADKTGIEWTDATWNPVTGCTKVSQGCKNCYAERDWARLVHLPAYTGRNFSDVRTHADRLEQPLRWKRPRRIFVNSMSDLFHESVPDEFIDRVFVVMSIANQHTFQLLTKRADRMRDYLGAPNRVRKIREAALALNGDIDESAICDHWPLPHVWLGVTVESQETVDIRIPPLVQTPAAVRFLSMEPLIGPVSLRWMPVFHENAPYVAQNPAGATNHLDGLRRIDWVIAGGESGPNARPMNLAWVRKIRDECEAAGVPFLFKQWGEWIPAKEFGSLEFNRVGKKAAGRLLDGVTHDGYPEGRL